MRFVYGIGLLSLFLGAVLWPSVGRATHVRAGEITTKRISQTSLTYQITFTAYYDEIGGKAAASQADSYIFCFGDGTTAEVKRSSRKFINGNTSSVNSYTVIHTYPGPGVYTIGITVQNRNQGTVNLPPPGSSTKYTLLRINDDSDQCGPADQLHPRNAQPTPRLGARGPEVLPQPGRLRCRRR